jgi:hypothetical protein
VSLEGAAQPIAGKAGPQGIDPVGEGLRDGPRVTLSLEREAQERFAGQGWRGSLLHFEAERAAFSASAPIFGTSPSVPSRSLALGATPLPRATRRLLSVRAQPQIDLLRRGSGVS